MIRSRAARIVGFDRQRAHLGARRHYFAGAGVVKIDHRLDQLALLFLDNSFGLADLHQGLEIVGIVVRPFLRGFRCDRRVELLLFLGLPRAGKGPSEKGR